MTASANTSRLALFEETTSGTAPADWVASGVLGFTFGVPDISGLQQSLIEDERSRTRTLKVFDKIKGVRSTATFSYVLAASGHAQGTIADGSQPTETFLAKVLKNALGGLAVAESTTLAAGGTHTTTSVELDDSTDYDAGSMIVLEDVDVPGTTHLRRILSKAGDIVTLDQELPFTPVDGDLVQGHLHAYVDEGVLCDSSTGNDTLSHAILMGGANPKAWQTVGTKTNLGEITIGSNEQIQMAFESMVGSFTEPNNFSAPAFTQSEDGGPANIGGVKMELYIQDVGTTTGACVDASELSITPGVTSARTEVVTECAAGMEGIQGYHLEQADTLINLTRVPYDTTVHDELESNDRKIVRYSSQTAAGSGWGVHFSTVEINATPTKGEAGNRLAQVVEMRAHEDEDNSAAPDADQWKSKISIVLW